MEDGRRQLYEVENEKRPSSTRSCYEEWIEEEGLYNVKHIDEEIKRLY